VAGLSIERDVGLSVLRRSELGPKAFGMDALIGDLQPTQSVVGLLHKRRRTAQIKIVIVEWQHALEQSQVDAPNVIGVLSGDRVGIT
jgi:hypothetical protein